MQFLATMSSDSPSTERKEPRAKRASRCDWNAGASGIGRARRGPRARQTLNQEASHTPRMPPGLGLCSSRTQLGALRQAVGCLAPAVSTNCAGQAPHLARSAPPAGHSQSMNQRALRRQGVAADAHRPPPGVATTTTASASVEALGSALAATASRPQRQPPSRQCAASLDRLMRGVDAAAARLARRWAAGLSSSECKKRLADDRPLLCTEASTPRPESRHRAHSAAVDSAVTQALQKSLFGGGPSFTDHRDYALYWVLF